MLPFITLARPVEVAGIGLHSGLQVRVKLLPAPRVGYVFQRVDLPGRPCLGADVQLVATTQHATTLKSGEASVSTTEHLLAALYGLGYTHCHIEIDGPEVPILDGSAAGWCQALDQAGRTELPGSRPRWQLARPVWIEDSGASVLGVPQADFRLSVGVDFGVPHAGAQAYDLLVTPHTFQSELAAARTFTLESWLPRLREYGLIKGGSEDNAIVIWENGPAPTLRFAEEMARHKALDAVGDLALMLAPTGAAFCGHLIAMRAGHGPHRAWMQRALAENAFIIH